MSPPVTQVPRHNDTFDTIIDLTNDTDTDPDDGSDAGDGYTASNNSASGNEYHLPKISTVRHQSGQSKEAKGPGSPEEEDELDDSGSGDDSTPGELDGGADDNEYRPPKCSMPRQAFHPSSAGHGREPNEQVLSEEVDELDNDTEDGDEQDSNTDVAIKADEDGLDDHPISDCDSRRPLERNREQAPSPLPPVTDHHPLKQACHPSEIRDQLCDLFRTANDLVTYYRARNVIHQTFGRINTLTTRVAADAVATPQVPGNRSPPGQASQPDINLELPAGASPSIQAESAPREAVQLPEAPDSPRGNDTTTIPASRTPTLNVASTFLKRYPTHRSMSAPPSTTRTLSPPLAQTQGATFPGHFTLVREHYLAPVNRGNGKSNGNIDGDRDPSSLSRVTLREMSRPLATFRDLPPEVVDAIVGTAHVSDVLTLRSVSRQLKAVVDAQRLPLHLVLRKQKTYFCDINLRAIHHLGALQRTRVLDLHDAYGGFDPGRHWKDCEEFKVYFPKSAAKFDPTLDGHARHFGELEAMRSLTRGSINVGLSMAEMKAKTTVHMVDALRGGNVHLPLYAFGDSSMVVVNVRYDPAKRLSISLCGRFKADKEYHFLFTDVDSSSSTGRPNDPISLLVNNDHLTTNTGWVADRLAREIARTAYRHGPRPVIKIVGCETWPASWCRHRSRQEVLHMERYFRDGLAHAFVDWRDLVPEPLDCLTKVSFVTLTNYEKFWRRRSPRYGLSLVTEHRVEAG